MNIKLLPYWLALKRNVFVVIGVGCIASAWLVEKAQLEQHKQREKTVLEIYEDLKEFNRSRNLWIVANNLIGLSLTNPPYQSRNLNETISVNRTIFKSTMNHIDAIVNMDYAFSVLMSKTFDSARIFAEKQDQYKFLENVIRRGKVAEAQTLLDSIENVYAEGQRNAAILPSDLLRQVRKKTDRDTTTYYIFYILGTVLIVWQKILDEKRKFHPIPEVAQDTAVS